MIDRFEEKFEYLFDQTRLVNAQLAAKWLVLNYSDKIVESAEMMVLCGTKKKTIRESDNLAVMEAYDILYDILWGEVQVMLEGNEELTFKECCDYIEKFTARYIYIYCHIYERLTKTTINEKMDKIETKYQTSFLK